MTRMAHISVLVVDLTFGEVYDAPQRAARAQPGLRPEPNTCSSRRDPRDRGEKRHVCFSRGFAEAQYRVFLQGFLVVSRQEALKAAAEAGRPTPAWGAIRPRFQRAPAGASFIRPCYENEFSSPVLPRSRRIAWLWRLDVSSSQCWMDGRFWFLRLSLFVRGHWHPNRAVLSVGKEDASCKPAFRLVKRRPPPPTQTGAARLERRSCATEDPKQRRQPFPSFQSFLSKILPLFPEPRSELKLPTAAEGCTKASAGSALSARDN